MNRQDLKRLKIDTSFIISPERFMAMFGIECDNVKKLNIHDLHYILGANLNHAGINQINIDRIYKGEILLIGTPKHFKAYYRPIIYKIKVNNKLKEEVVQNEVGISDMSLSDLYNLYLSAENIEQLDKYLNEIYERSNFDSEDELVSNRSKIYAFSNKTKYHWY